METSNGVKFVRTPDSRFENLPNFPFEPHYTLVDGLRIHYIDVGPQDGEVVLMLHGQPTWAYLYRKMIPIISKAGFRAIAMDHIGMERSDKPIDIGIRTFEQLARLIQLSFYNYRQGKVHYGEDSTIGDFNHVFDIMYNEDH